MRPLDILRKNAYTERMKYDILILGGGIAGCTAAVYAARAGKKVAIIERGELGGQLNVIAELANYPGFKHITGPELARLVGEQAMEAGADRITADIAKVTFGDEIVVATDGETYTADGAVIALGANAARLGLPRETELTGDGVHYCATCDGRFYKNQDVAVVGSSVKAAHDVRYLCGLCRKVYLVTDEQISDLPSNCEQVAGDAAELTGTPLSGLKVNTGGAYRQLDVTGVFVAKGFVPNTRAVRGAVELDDKGFVKTDAHMRTSVERVYAAGDSVSKSYRQLVTAAGEAATAVHYLLRDLRKN